MDNPKYAELVAVFNNEESYIFCLPLLEKLCKSLGFTHITEAVEDDDNKLFT